MDESFIQMLDAVIAQETKKLKREQNDFEFTDSAKEIDQLHGYVQDLKDNNAFYLLLPEDQQNELRALIERLNNAFSAIANFRPAEITNPQDERNRLAGEVKDIYRQIFKFINQLELFQLKTSGQKGQLTNITKEANLAVKEAKDSAKQIKDLLQTAQKTTASKSVSDYLGIFSETSIKSKMISFYWLGGAGLLSIALVIVMFYITKDMSQSIKELNTTPAIVAYITTKLFFLAILVYLVQQCVRNYMANMHQAVLNHHRENSLKVFNAMVKSSSGAETTDQILQYLSKSIFDSGETGFFPGKDIAKDGPDLIQIFKDIGKPR